MIRSSVLLLAVLFLCCHTALTQSSAQSNQAQASNQAADQKAAPVGWLQLWRSATLSFGTIEKDELQGKYYKVKGSGVVIATTNQQAFIFTAKHVFYDPDKKWHPSEIRIRYGWQDQASVYSEFGTSLTLRDGSGKDLWTALPDGSDIAAIPAQAIMYHQPALNPDAIAKADDLYDDATVVVLGYPGIVGNEYLVRAIVRRGSVAWLDPKDPFEKPFLIDANIYPGNSGGPVIKVPFGPTKEGSVGLGGRIALLGLVVEAPGQSGDIELKVPGQSRPLKVHEEIPVGGTGVVEPAGKVSKLLDLMK